MTMLVVVGFPKSIGSTSPNAFHGVIATSQAPFAIAWTLRRQGVPMVPVREKGRQ